MPICDELTCPICGVDGQIELARREGAYCKNCGADYAIALVDVMESGIAAMDYFCSHNPDSERFSSRED